MAVIGDYIADELARQGKDQVWLAQQTNLSTSAISAIVTGKTELPGPDTVRAIAQALGVEGARLTFMLGYPIDMGGNAARYDELSLRIQAAPRLMERLPDLLELPRQDFLLLMEYLDFQMQKHRPRLRRKNPPKHTDQ